MSPRSFPLIDWRICTANQACRVENSELADLSSEPFLARQRAHRNARPPPLPPLDSPQHAPPTALKLQIRKLSSRKEGGRSESARTNGLGQTAAEYPRAPQRTTRRTLKLKAVLIGTLLNLSTSTSQKCEAVPRRARI